MRPHSYVAVMFGCDVVMSVDLPPGKVQLMGPPDTVIDTPADWLVMDNAERIQWLAEAYPQLMIVMGAGSTEDMFMSQGGFLV